MFAFIVTTLEKEFILFAENKENVIPVKEER